MTWRQVWTSVRCRVVGLWLFPLIAVRNRCSQSMFANDSADVVVSLTSYGARVRFVHLTIESIVRGRTRPRRIILWLDEGTERQGLTPGLERLKKRGLEVCFTADVKSHKKYFPYVMATPAHTAPLVTADDDVLYPADWLLRLTSAATTRADVVWCWRARTVRQREDAHFQHYASWPLCGSTRVSHLTVPTGTSGVLYPAEFLEVLRETGDGFRGVADAADDLWLHHVALRAGFAAAQIRPKATHFPLVPSLKVQPLYKANVVDGNDGVLARLYTESDRLRLLAETPPDEIALP